MKTILSGAAAGLALLALSGTARAQSPVDVSSLVPISVEARAGVAAPTGSFADLAGNAFSFGASVHVQVAPRVSLYGGYSQADFDLETTARAEGTDAGWEAGARVAFPGVGFSPWVRAGLLFHDFEIEVAGNEFDGEDEIGFELGAGAAFPMGPRVALSPGVAYRRYSTEFPGREENVSYLNVDVGLRIRL